MVQRPISAATQTRTIMKATFHILAVALLATCLPLTVEASDTRPVYNSKGQLIAVVPKNPAPAHSAAVTEPSHYIANPSGKGGAVVPSKNVGDVTNIAVFKSKKTKCCN
jgi:hypothetical protein